MAGQPAYNSPEVNFGALQPPPVNQGFNSWIPSHTVALQHQWNPGNHFPRSDPSLINFGSPELFDPTGFSNEAIFADLGQQNQLPGATVNNQSSVPLYGTQMMGGRFVSVSEKLSKPEAHFTAILGMVSLSNRLRLMECPSVSNHLKPTARHPLSQGYHYQHQRLPRLNHRQLGTPQRSPLTRDLKPSLMGSGLRPQTKALMRDFLFLHPLQMSSI